MKKKKKKTILKNIIFIKVKLVRSNNQNRSNYFSLEYWFNLFLIGLYNRAFKCNYFFLIDFKNLLIIVNSRYQRMKITIFVLTM